MMHPGYLMPSPLGDIAICANERALIGVFFVGQKYYPSLSIVGQDEHIPEVVRHAEQQLQEFFKGERRVFDLPLDLRGTDFQRRVWQELLTIPFGEMISYGTMARNMGLSSGHSRAVGSANSKNPVSIIVPCHRVIGAAGDLTGYAGGMDRKRALLELENPIGDLFS